MPAPEILRQYTVRSGDSFTLISKRFYTTIPKLTELNPSININSITIGQKVIVPLPIVEYSIVSGDTLSAIATKYKTNINFLQEINPTINPNILNIGQIIYVPTPVGEFTLIDEAEVKKNSLSLTSLFETSTSYPNNYGVTAGNFDGAGISWGAIQYNAKTGPLISMWQSLINNYPTQTRDAFNHASYTVNQNQANYDEWKALFLAGIFADILPWADARSDVATGKHSMIEPWKTYFSNLGKSAEGMAIQIENASWYYSVAKTWFDQLGLWSRRGFALCFDIAVQSGSMNPSVAGTPYDLISEINTWYTNQDKTGKTAQQLETLKLVQIANRRADYVDPTWQQSYRDRKTSVANGTGTVYGSLVMDTTQYNAILEPYSVPYVQSVMMFTLESVPEPTEPTPEEPTPENTGINYIEGGNFDMTTGTTNFTNVSITGDFYVKSTDQSQTVSASPMLAINKLTTLAELQSGFTLIPAITGKSIIVEKIQMYVDSVIEPVATTQLTFRTKEATPKVLLTTEATRLGSGAKINTDGFSYFTETSANMRHKLPAGVAVEVIPVIPITAGALVITVYYRYV